MDGCGSTDGSVGKEHCSKPSEDSVGQPDGAVHHQVELHVRTLVVGQEGMCRGQLRPGGGRVNMRPQSSIKNLLRKI